MQTAGPDIFRSEDFYLGIVTACGAVVLAILSDGVRGNGVIFLGAVAALGIALTGIVAAVLTLFVALFDENYRRAIQRTPGGWGAAVRPYKAIIVVSVGATTIGVTGLLVWAVTPPWLQALLLGLASGLAVWALVGTVQVVFLTAFHGDQRFKLMSAIDDARQELERRRKGKSAG